MADTKTSAALTVQQWDSQFFTEYVRNNRFRPYMGTTTNSIIQTKEDLTRSKGDRITLPLVGKLSGAGRTGNQVLEGFEETLDNYGWEIPVDVLRNAIVVTDWEEQQNAIELRNAAREQLMTWAMQQLRGGRGANSDVGIIEALGAFYDGSTYANYGDASESVKDGWLTNNSDRVLFGNSTSNLSAGDHSASLANVDTSNDQLGAAEISLMKRLAQDADPHIRPIRTAEDAEFFVAFCGSRAFRDLKNDSTIQQANREGWQRYASMQMGRGQNPIFRGGDLVYDGVIIREVPEIPVLEGVGNSSSDVDRCFLCGAQAVGVAWAQRTRSVTQNTDYDFRHGVAVSEIRGVRKMFFNDIQHGMVTGHFAGAPD
jgi:N4-gp56 family major capsid protein